MEWRDRAKQRSREASRTFLGFPTLQAFWDSRGRREENGGRGYETEMSPRQAKEPGKVSNFRWVLDPRSGVGTRISRLATHGKGQDDALRCPTFSPPGGTVRESFKTFVHPGQSVCPLWNGGQEEDLGQSGN